MIADGKAEVRSALALLVSEEPDMHVTGEAHDVSSLLDVTRSVRPNLVLVDWEIADTRPANARGTSLTAEIAATSPMVRVIVLCGRPEIRNDALAAGADAFVCKGDAPEHLLAALRNVNGRD